MRQGLSRPIAVCPSCAGKRLRPGLSLVVWLLLVAAVVVVLVASGLWLLR